MDEYLELCFFGMVFRLGTLGSLLFFRNRFNRSMTFLYIFSVIVNHQPNHQALIVWLNLTLRKKTKKKLGRLHW